MIFNKKSVLIFFIYNLKLKIKIAFELDIHYIIIVNYKFLLHLKINIFNYNYKSIFSLNNPLIDAIQANDLELVQSILKFPNVDINIICILKSFLMKLKILDFLNEIYIIFVNWILIYFILTTFLINLFLILFQIIYLMVFYTIIFF